MGLDIVVIQYAEKVPEGATFDEDNMFTIYPQPHFEKHLDFFEVGDVYAAEEVFHFRAGSYSGYNLWRKKLAEMAGYENVEDVWKNKTSGPFFELINFSDCEGIIGPDTSKKLYDDFVAFEEQAKTFDASQDGFDDWFFEKYKSWKEAFSLAKENGGVLFR